jgi:hypothetical protein
MFMSKFAAAHFRALLDKITLIEDSYGLVMTPSGRGQVVKQDAHIVYVQLDDGEGDIKGFPPSQVSSVEQQDRRAVPREHGLSRSFTPAQQRAGLMTPVLKG